MYKRRLLEAGIVFFCLVFLVSTVSFADELADIQFAIKAKGGKWTAGETSMMKLSKEERKKRLGLIPDLAPEPSLAVAPEEQSAVVTASLDWRNNGETLSLR